MRKKILIILISFILIMILCCSCSLAGFINNNNNGQNINRVEIDLSDLSDHTEASIVANNCVDSCIRIETSYMNGNNSAGAGFIITSDGYVITNRHVVQQYRSGYDLPRSLTDTKLGLSSIKIIFSNNLYYEADLVYVSTDPTIDVAILKINANGITFKYLKLDDKTQLFYGQNAYTFGNPSNIGLTFSGAMIANPSISFNSTAANGSSVTFEDIILLDSNVNHGNSGGALISNKGNVIGIIYGRIESSDSSVNDVYGLGLAIPTSKIINIIKQSGSASKIKYTLYEGNDSNQENEDAEKIEDQQDGQE